MICWWRNRLFSEPLIRGEDLCCKMKLRPGCQAGYQVVAKGAKAICTELFSPEIRFNLVSLSRKSHLASKLENVSTLTE